MLRVIPPGGSDGDAPASRPVKRSQLNAVITVLQTITSDLELRAVELSAPVERERSERLQERESGDRLKDEIAAPASQFSNNVDEAAARERYLQVQLGRAMEEAATSSARTDAMKAEMEAIRSRPW